jgi:hypothetical protein
MPKALEDQLKELAGPERFRVLYPMRDNFVHSPSGEPYQ